MISIDIDNVKCKIYGLSPSQNAMLYDKLSYEDDQTIYLKLKKPELFGVDMRKRLFTPKRCTFPVGLLPRARTLLKDDTIIIRDNRKTPEKYNYFMLQVPFNKPRYYQREVAETIRNNARVTASMCTGSGKTDVIMQAIVDRGVNTLIIVPTLNLKNQFLQTLKYHFGNKVIGTHKDTKLKEIVVANVQGIQRMDEVWFKHFDQVVIDEVHHGSAPSYYDLNKKYWTHITYRLFVTATLMRGAGDGMKLEGLVGPADYRYTAKQAIADGYIVPPKFFIYEFKHFYTPSEGWHIDYEKNLVKQRARNEIVLKAARKFLDHTNKNILILCNRIEHVDFIASNLEGSRIVTGKTKGNQKVFEDYRMGNVRCMVATSQVLSEGIDIPQIDVLILAGGYESEILMNQAVGRVVRLDKERGKKFAIVIDIFDKNQKILERHSKTRLKIFKETYGADAIKWAS